MNVTEAREGVKVYNLSSGKSLQEWYKLHEAGTSLRKNREFRSRIELLQDGHFPVASTKVIFTPDGNHMIGIGTYKPMVKVWDLEEMSLKFERVMDNEAVDVVCVGDTWRKFVVMRRDRYLEFHGRQGKHFSTRIPKFGRSLAYEPETCDLYAAGSSSDVYRINLEQGRFLSSLETEQSAFNTAAANPLHTLMAFGSVDGVVEAWDARDRRRCGALSIADALDEERHGSAEITAFAYAHDGLSFAVGTEGGCTLLYDLRSAKPLRVKEQGSGSRIESVSFHGPEAGDSSNAHATLNIGPCVMSSDKRLVKVWSRQTGDTVVNIESDVSVTHTSAYSRDTGMIFAAGEQERIQVFYVPMLGPAPRWCSFIDNITEELEEDQRERVFDNFKFVSKDEFERLGLENLVGTKYLRPYMHGFFVDLRLYNKVFAAANPFAFADYRKQRVRERIEAERRTRIHVPRAAPEPAVNAELARRMRERKRDERERDEAAEAQESEAQRELIDSRFGDIFTNPDFAIEKDSIAHRRVQSASGRQQHERLLAEQREHEQREREPQMFEMRGERTSSSLAAVTAAAVRGGKAADRVTRDVAVRDAPLAARAQLEPEALKAERVVREMAFSVTTSTKSKKKKRKR